MIQPPEQLRKRIGLEHLSLELFAKALTHRSAGSANNERLEFLGDAVLGFVIAEALYEQFPEAAEGELSRLRARLVKQDSLAGLARDLEFGDYLIIGPGERKSGGFRRASLLSDALEAVIGALLLDQGEAACKEWILTLFSSKLSSLTLGAGQKDPKTRLQEKMQAAALGLPEYNLTRTSGADHQQSFEVTCHVPLLDRPMKATGASRKKAEQEAAKRVLEEIGETI